MAEEGERQSDQPTVHWDESSMTTSYANIVNVASSREEVMVFFGTNQTWNVTEDRELNVKLSDRIILNPHAAKRLLMLLDRAIRGYESRYGAIELGQTPIGESSAQTISE